MPTNEKINQNLTEENICIPLDIFMDIAKIILKESLSHEITKVIENRSTVYISIYLNKTTAKHQQLLENINNLLHEYNEYRFGEAENVDWRTN